MTGFLVRLYGFMLLQESMVIYPFYAVMFVDHGLTAPQISTLFAVWAGIVIVLEVPSGVLADRASRRGILSGAQWIRAAGFACWLLAPGFWGFLAGFLLWGTKSALTSGTLEALVYDELHRRGREADFVRVHGRTRAAGTAGVILSSAGASLLAGLGTDLLIVVSIGTGVASALLVLALPSPPPAEATTPVRPLAHMRDGLRFVAGDRRVLGLVVFMAAVVGLSGGLDEYYTIFADEAGVPRASLGVILGGLCGVQALAGIVAHRFGALSNRMLHGGFALGAALLTVAAWWMHPAGLALLALFVFLSQASLVVGEARLQDRIPTPMRATVSSVRGLVCELAAICLFLGMGAVVGAGPYRVGFLVFGGLGTLAALAAWIAGVGADTDRA